MVPDMEVTIFEAAHQVLRKVEVSGGGRCNCTNSFEAVTDLSQVYPRGHRLMKRLMNLFSHHDAYRWFQQRGVQLVAQDDHCVFPQSQDSHTIINLFLSEARRLGIIVKTQHRVNTLDQLHDFDFIVVTIGGNPNQQRLAWLQQETTPLVPSLFTFSIDDKKLKELMGAVVNTATVTIPKSKLRASGPLLITHWGMSGPAILRLSSYAAQLLADNNYHMPLSVNWASQNEADVQQQLNELKNQYPQKQVNSMRPFNLPTRLWHYLAEKCLGERASYRWRDINQKELNRLTNLLVNDTYQIAGRATFKDEFVTCGGISLSAVNPNTLESKTRPGLYFAGEVLDIDGVTGGFNFQAAWTTAYCVSSAIRSKSESLLP
jgi:hypothetical protein